MLRRRCWPTPNPRTDSPVVPYSAVDASDASMLPSEWLEKSKCLGLEAFPTVRRTGRFVNYTDGVLSSGASHIVAGLVVSAARSLEHVTNERGPDSRDLPRLADLIAQLASCTLEELATGAAFCMGDA
jgi:hypothetical protein